MIQDQVVISDKELGVCEELVTNTTDAAGEKYMPVINYSNNKVKVDVGSIEHPSLSALYIE